VSRDGSPAAAYDEIAAWYDASVEAPGSLAAQVADQVVWLCGEVAKHRLCDLACGQGVVARRLARRGALVTAIDLSERLLEIARGYEQAEPLGVDYQRTDAQTLLGIEEASFDGVTCSLALMDIPDMAAVFRSVRRVLRPSAWFVFSITHPCFQMPRLPQAEGSGDGEIPATGAYFREGFWRSDYPHGVRGRVGAYHRTLGAYLNGLIGAGLVLEQIIEMRSEGVAVEPKFLIVRSRKERE
jgi:2-polyprenyl-3-methyl-5-hydroxy-6-metoxy-1,4-benzoquinol methylase